MGFYTHIRYSVDCEIRLDADGVAFRPSAAAWAALGAAYGDDDETRKPLYEAVGRPCPADVRDIRADTAAAARRDLAKLGWTFVRIPGGWRAACPDHKGALDLPEVDDSAVRAVIARQLEQYAPTGDGS